jgi:hypothetical protein
MTVQQLVITLNMYQKRIQKNHFSKDVVMDRDKYLKGIVLRKDVHMSPDEVGLTVIVLASRASGGIINALCQKITDMGDNPSRPDSDAHAPWRFGLMAPARARSPKSNQNLFIYFGPVHRNEMLSHPTNIHMAP